VSDAGAPSGNAASVGGRVAPEAHVAFPIVVAAPSGTGKTTVCREVVDRDDGIVFSVSHTTRRKRSGETDGKDYHFVEEDRFQQLVAEGAFLEWAVYNDHRYGTSWAAIDAPLAEGRDVLLEIEVQGARQVRERRSDARFIFLLPPSLEALRDRLTRRGTDSPAQVERRLELARRELHAIGDFDYAVENDDLETCVRHVLEILAAERRGACEPLRERFDTARARERLLGVE
jgi:guanylate kinase